jgi:hypothetical protein
MPRRRRVGPEESEAKRGEEPCGEEPCGEERLIRAEKARLAEATEGWTGGKRSEARRGAVRRGASDTRGEGEACRGDGAL